MIVRNHFLLIIYTYHFNRCCISNRASSRTVSSLRLKDFDERERRTAQTTPSHASRPIPEGRENHKHPFFHRK